jgi:hypothetical protein
LGLLAVILDARATHPKRRTGTQILSHHAELVGSSLEENDQPRNQFPNTARKSITMRVRGWYTTA